MEDMLLDISNMLNHPTIMLDPPTPPPQTIKMEDIVAAASSPPAFTLTVAGTTFTVTQSAAAPLPPGTLSAPTASSPVGGQTVTATRPDLVVTNSEFSFSSGSSSGSISVLLNSAGNGFNDPIRTSGSCVIGQHQASRSGTIGCRP